MYIQCFTVTDCDDFRWNSPRQSVHETASAAAAAAAHVIKMAIKHLDDVMTRLNQ